MQDFETIILNKAHDTVRVSFWVNRGVWCASLDADDAPIGTGTTKREAREALLRHDLTAWANNDEDDDEAGYWASHDREVQSLWTYRQ